MAEVALTSMPQSSPEEQKICPKCLRGPTSRWHMKAKGHLIRDQVTDRSPSSELVLGLSGTRRGNFALMVRPLSPRLLLF